MKAIKHDSGYGIPFSQRTRGRAVETVFEREDHWVWCPSVVRDRRNRYSMFASSWPKSLPFLSSYPLCSAVIRAEADLPHGPFEFREVVLPDRGAAHWDGRATHNPQVHRIGDGYALFYIGTTYPDPQPTRPGELCEDLIQRAYNGFRIGCAVAESPEGPWRRLDKPVLDVRPGRWDSTIVTNPAVCVCPDGALLMLYRSNTPRGCRLGVARAARLGAPFERLSDEPILEDMDIEDPFVWYDPRAERFEMIAKDLSGRATGECHAGLHATSEDGVHWRPAETPKAYSRRFVDRDGAARELGHMERPYVLFDEQGAPAMLYLATAEPEGSFKQIESRMTRTWISAISLIARESEE